MEGKTAAAPREELPLRLEELLRRASRDALSGLLNRDTMEREIRRRLAALLPEEACALFILDLDNFKQVNDTFGHQAGDQAIRESARMLSGLFRASDIIGRLGGDEFAVFLTGARITEELLHRKAAQICDTLQLSVGENGTVSLTASVGVCLADANQTFEGLYQSADLALYRAKKSGKHRYCLKVHDRFEGEAPADCHPISAIPLNRLLETMASGVALLEMGPQPRVVYVSPSFCRLIGADPGAYPVPQPLTALVHPDDFCALEQALREGLRSCRPVEYTHRLATADARRWLWCHTRAERIPYDSPRPMLLVTGSDVSAYKEKEQRLTESNRRLRTAFDQVAQQMWEVDLAARTFSLYAPGGGEPSAGTAFPDGMVETGWVHPRSARAFCAFARALCGGQAQGYGNFLLRLHPADRYRWTVLSYRLLCDEAGRAVRAVGVAEPLDQTFRRYHPGANPKGVMPSAMLADLVAEMRLNLTRDTVEELWVEGQDQTAAWAGVPAWAMLRQQRAGLRRDDSANGADDFSACFSTAQMRAQFGAGRRWLAAVYQRVDAGGNIRRVRHLVRMTQDPQTGALLAFGCLLHLHLPAVWERRLCTESGAFDPITRLYDRGFIARAAGAFAGAGAGAYAVAVVQALGLAAGQGEDPAPARRTRQGIAAAFAAALGGGCLLGQYAPDQLVVLFPLPLPQEELQRRLEEAFAFLRIAVQEGLPPHTLRFVAGVAVRQADAEPYEEMLNRALCLCGLCWNAPGDMVAFTREGETLPWALPEGAGQEAGLREQPAGADRPLTEEEKDVALRCMAAMLAAETLESSVQGVLQQLGVYCGADRVYIVSLAPGGRVITMPYEWTGPGKTGIRQAVSGLPRGRFPLLERCMAQRKPVFLSRSQPPGGEGAWRFAVYPLLQKERVEGFLCMENARRHADDAALVNALLPLLQREPERFSRSGGMAGDVGRLMGMPDLRAYLATVAGLDAARYTSLGAVCLDIPGIAAINGSHGFAYGSQLLWYACQAMADVFGPDLLFRTWEAEFVAFLPNTTQPVFAGRCERLRSILRRRYPRDLRLGFAWAEGDFTGRSLVDAARRSMAAERVGVPPGLPDLLLAPPGEPRAALENGVRAVVYFQPKVALFTGRLAGAEALVRGVGPDGRLIPPDSFLPELEETGGIRELDLYVLDRALAQVDRWRAEGLGVVPVAVNLSRVTLRSPSLPASILAIQSRYPALPPSALELEITEQADAVGTETLHSLVAQFHSFGLRVSLDDFGARYANLSLFASVPFDAVKLDRSLVADLAGNPVNRQLVHDIFQLCRMRGIDCLAEGVETPEQVRLLQDAGCTWAQGFYYDPPLPADRFAQRYLQPAPPAAPTQRRNHG